MEINVEFNPKKIKNEAEQLKNDILNELKKKNAEAPDYLKIYKLLNNTNSNLNLRNENYSNRTEEAQIKTLLVDGKLVSSDVLNKKRKCNFQIYVHFFYIKI